MKNFMKFATQGVSAFSELQKKYPSLSVAEIMKALKKSGGDPKKAMEHLQALTSSGGGATAGSAPDIRTDPVGWYKFYDENGNGLERHEVAAAIAETFKEPDRSRVLAAVQTNWSQFDPDGSNSISRTEFMQPNGLRDVVVSVLGGGSGAHAAPQAAPSGPLCKNGCGRRPFRDYPTCCTHCKGPVGPHAQSCSASCSGGVARPSDGPAAHRHSAFNPSSRGRRKALLIGINYVGQKAELKGCVNDVKHMYKLLTEVYRWDPSCIRTLTENEATYRNILSEAASLVAGAQPGDAIVFHYSGHGAQQEDPRGYEEDGMNETIIPVDFKRAGMITDDQLMETLIAPLPEGARLTAVMDCCHSGTGLDLPFTHTGREWKQDVNPYFTACDAQLFSGCQDDQTSADVQSRYGQAGGAMTQAFCEELRSNPQPSYTELINSMNRTMKKRGFKQRPQLTSSQPFRFPRQFTLTDAAPNMNATLGRIATQRFKPNPRPFAAGDPLAEMLGPLAAMAIPLAAAIGGKKAQTGLDMIRAGLTAIGK
jgi:hypothetical protein